jgi:hypothetical protein
VVACDPQEAILDDRLKEDHVGFHILYCPSTVLAMMTIWKWPLVQTIYDGYPLEDHFITFYETHILDVDDVEAIGVKKKNNSFHKKKSNVANFEGSIFRIEKVLLEESMHNVGATKCCTQ